jgi:hypothetical protein
MTTSVTLGLLRLATQRIAASTWKTPADAARGMLAMQGQDYTSVKWSLGLRVPGATHADVEAAFMNGTIVRSWPLRGTLHVTAPEDLAWMLDLLGPRVLASVASRRAALSLDDRTIERARDLALEALSGGKHLSREELQSLWQSRGIDTAGQRGYHLLFHLSVTQTLCFGPPRGKEQTFVLLSEWVKKPRRLDREDALRELATRFVESHGPATLLDLAGWAKLTLTDAKLGVTLSGKRIGTLEHEGTRYLIAPDAEDLLARAREPGGTVHLLPGFDEYILGYKERGAVLHEAHFEHVVPGGNGIFMPTVVKDGRVIGTWHRTHKAKETTMEARIFPERPVKAAHPPMDRVTAQAFSRAAEAYGRFLGVTIRVLPGSSPSAES